MRRTEERSRLARRLAPVGALLTGLLLAFPGLAIDTDQDGVDDAFDNCTLVANAAQVDSNGDGFGNACDADLDGDGSVTPTDFFGHLRPCIGTAVASDPSCADADFDGDGIVGAADFFGVFRPSLRGAPGPGNPDADGDGLSNVEDHCPQSPPGAAVDAEGCSGADLVLDPQRALAPVSGPIDALLARLVEQGALSPIQAALQDAKLDLEDGVGLLGRGDFCQARSPFTDSVRGIAAVRGVLLALIADREGQAPPPVPDGEEADVPESESEALDWRVRLADLDEVTGLLGALRNRVEGACKDVAQPDASVRGFVGAFDEARGFLTLDDPAGGPPRTVVLSKDFASGDHLYPGRLVEVQGALLADSTLVATTGQGIGVEQAIDPGLSYIECIRLQIAPVQPALSQLNYSGAVDLFDPAGYRGNTTGKLLLERGMGIGAIDLGCAPPGPPKFVRNTFRVEMQYRSTGGQLKTVTLASDLKPNQRPVPFPADVAAGLGSDDAQLTVTYRHQSCLFLGFGTEPSCSEVVEQASTGYTLRFLAKGGYCLASYDDTEFELEDGDQASFGRTRVSSKFLLADLDPNTASTFVARGYRSDSPSSSSFPNVQDVYEGQYFAVYNHDFYTDPNVLFPEATYGVTNAAALAWPKAVGVHNGQFFSYSCRLPDLVRDRIDSCSPAPDSYYRLPFFPGFPIWTLSQGNDGSFTHNGKQRFAFDFVAAPDTPIRAARGGRVVFVREDQTGNSYYNPNCSNCSANAVVIRHQDGSEAAYFHMPTNGVSVAVNQKVERGDTIAKVGNTGYSTGAHLHFQAQVPASGGQTLRSRFETVNHSCWIPPSNTGDLLSNNL